MDLKQQIFNVNDLKVLTVDCPEWGCILYVRSWSGAERMAVQAADKDAPDFLAKLVAFSACEGDGKRLFSADDVPALNEKNGAVLERVALAALKHNGVTGGAVDDEKKG